MPTASVQLILTDCQVESEWLRCPCPGSSQISLQTIRPWQAYLRSLGAQFGSSVINWTKKAGRTAGYNPYAVMLLSTKSTPSLVGSCKQGGKNADRWVLSVKSTENRRKEWECQWGAERRWSRICNDQTQYAFANLQHHPSISKHIQASIMLWPCRGTVSPWAKMTSRQRNVSAVSKRIVKNLQIAATFHSSNGLKVSRNSCNANAWTKEENLLND